MTDRKPPRETSSVHPNPSSPPPSDTGRPPGRKKKRRWLRRFILLVVLLVVFVGALIGLAPTIISTETGTGYVLSFANGLIHGDVGLDDLSLSWGGPVEIRGLTVSDPEQQEVLRVDRVSLPGGVWGIITSPLSLGEITIDTPQTVLYLKPGGGISIVDAFQLRKPRPKKDEPITLPEIHGKLHLASGTVKVVRPDGTSVQANDLVLDVDLRTFNQIDAQLGLTLPDETKLEGQVDVQQIAPGGRLDVTSAKGTIKLTTDHRMDVRPIAEFAAGKEGASGSAGFNLDGQITPGKARLALAADVAKFQFARRARVGAEPVSARLNVTLDYTPENLAVVLDADGDPGTVHADLDFRTGGTAPDVTFDRILASLLTGEPIALPEFTLNANSQVDLARLGQAVPELLAVRQDRQLASGQLTLRSLNVTGGSNASAAAELAIRDLAARSTDGGGLARLDDMTVVLDSVIEAGQGLNVRKLELITAFATVSASGTPTRFAASFDARLDRLQSELGQIFDMSQGQVAGTIKGTLNASRPSEERVDISLDAQAQSVQYITQDSRFDLDHGTVTKKGYVTLDDKKVVALTLTEATADLSDEVAVTANGNYEFEQGGWNADIQITRGNLTFLSSRAAGLGLAELARYAGNVGMTASLRQASRNQPLATTGQVTASNLQVDGQLLLEGESRLEWSGVNLATDMSSVNIGQVSLKSRPATLDAADIQFLGGDKPALQGKAGGVMDLAACLKALALVGKWESTPTMGGRLTMEATGRTQGKAIELTGTSTIDNLTVGVGENTLEPGQVMLAYGLNLDSDARTIRLQQGRLESRPLSLEVTGHVNEYNARKVLDLNGRYQASWPELTAILHELVPATRDTISLAGQSASTFSLKGAAGREDVKPAFRDVITGLDLSWASANAYDIELGKATLSPMLKDGKLSLPEATVPASQGQIRLRADIDLAPDEPRLTIPGKLVFLDNVVVTEELSRSILSRINPIFYHLARVDGRAQLDLQNIDVPLGESIKTTGTGRGHLDLSDMKMGPAGMFAELLALGGRTKDEVYPVKVSGVDFVLEDGRIMYDNFQLIFPEDFDLIFRGSVGFDETLDLVVSIPVRPEMLERFKVKDSVVDVARVLANLRIDVPITGTREKPKLDFSQVDFKSLLGDAIKEDAAKTATDTAINVLKLLGPKKKDE